MLKPLFIFFLLQVLGKAVVGPGTGGEELAHWNDMIRSGNKPVASWHCLLPWALVDDITTWWHISTFNQSALEVISQPANQRRGILLRVRVHRQLLSYDHWWCMLFCTDRSFFFLLQFDVVDKHFTASNLALLFMDFMRCSQTGSHRRRLDQTLIAGRDRQSQTLDCLIGCDKMHYRCIQKNVAEANDVALSFARHLETVLWSPKVIVLKLCLKLTSIERRWRSLCTFSPVSHVIVTPRR